MIPVPSRRLLLIVAALIPVAAMAGPLPVFWPVCVLGLAGVGLLAAIDLLAGPRAADFPIVTAPPVIRATRDRPATIHLVVPPGGGQVNALRLALALPSLVRSERQVVDVAWPAGGRPALVDWPCVGLRRGRWQIGPVALEADSPWGFWQLRRRQEIAAEIRVYPNLFSERRQLAALFLNRGQSGIARRRMVGRGRDFERLREYQPGDSYDEVHWKATAKRGRPVTKVFQIERTQEIYVVIDASRLSARPVTVDGRLMTTLERHITAALVLLLAASRQGDRFGLVVHDARLRTFLRASNGALHYGACREAVHAMEPAENTPDFGELFATLRMRLRRRALLVFLTDLSDPLLAEDFTRHVRLIARQHLVLVNQIRVPGVEPVFTRPVAGEADLYDRLAGHFQWREARDTAARLQPLGVAARLLDHERLASDLVSQYLQVKGRQAL
ncbi:MAG TPA: DUF58 domain-containing protein [Candidatus Didemnitutus sp.]|nr:DUF58 domain-containing protein [Candidatus Didemnitutus sp.]